MLQSGEEVAERDIDARKENALRSFGARLVRREVWLRSGRFFQGGEFGAGADDLIFAGAAGFLVLLAVLAETGADSFDTRINHHPGCLRERTYFAPRQRFGRGLIADARFLRANPLSRCEMPEPACSRGDGIGEFLPDLSQCPNKGEGIFTETESAQTSQNARDSQMIVIARREPQPSDRPGRQPVGIRPTSNHGQFAVLGANGAMTIYRLPQ